MVHGQVSRALATHAEDVRQAHIARMRAQAHAPADDGYFSQAGGEYFVGGGYATQGSEEYPAYEGEQYAAQQEYVDPRGVYPNYSDLIGEWPYGAPNHPEVDENGRPNVARQQMERWVDLEVG